MSSAEAVSTDEEAPRSQEPGTSRGQEEVSLAGPGSPCMVVLELLQGAWCASMEDANDKEHVRLFFKQPAVFAMPEMRGAVYHGTFKSDRRQFLLLDVAAVPSLQQQLTSELASAREQRARDPGQGQQRRLQQLVDEDEQEESSSGPEQDAASEAEEKLRKLSLQGSNGQGPPAAVAAASCEGSGGGQCMLPDLDQLPRTRAGPEYTNISPVDMSDAGKCLAVFKAIMKNNKDVKKQRQQQERLVEARRQLQVARAMVARHQPQEASPAQAVIQDATAVGAADAGSSHPLPGAPDMAASLDAAAATKAAAFDAGSPHVVIVSVDLEWYEADQNRLLEIGWSCWDSVSGSIESKHWIVSEHLNCHNGRYVPDHKQFFGFGTSITGPKKEGALALQQDLDPGAWACRWNQQSLPRLALVGHGMAGDLKLLDSMGITLASGTEIIDTNCLAWALLGGKEVQHSLRALLSWTEVPDVTKLHNGGNDARYTLEAMLRMSRLGM